MDDDNCYICGVKRILVKPGVTACPNYYGSPMHNCDWVVFQMRDGLTEEKAKEECKKRLESTYKCTLEEYLTALNNLPDDWSRS